MIYEIDVIQCPGDSDWIALSDVIPLATQAASFEALIERVWRLAPSLIASREQGGAARRRLRFVLETDRAP